MADFQNKVVITNAGTAAISSLLSSGSPAIQISGFSVGTGGYLSSNPTVVVPPDPSATALINEIFHSSSVGQQSLSASTTVYSGTLNPGDAVGAIGEFGLWATYLTGSNAILPGNQFLFAIMHTPMKSITAEDSYIFQLPIII